MICKIADLVVDVPSIGDLPSRCSDYLFNLPESISKPDITIQPELVQHDAYPTLGEVENIYLETGFCFYQQLLRYQGLMLHASCVVVNGGAYLFSGPCGVGKSTHSGKYLAAFPGARIINDDKPALRRVNDRWYAYGTPWCGKDGINANQCAPIAGICFLRQGEREMQKLTPIEALPQLLRQTVGRYYKEEAQLLIRHLDLLIREVPIFRFTNHAEPGDEYITYGAMKPTREEG